MVADVICLSAYQGCRGTPYPVPCLSVLCPSTITDAVPLPTCIIHQLVLQFGSEYYSNYYSYGSEYRILPRSSVLRHDTPAGSVVDAVLNNQTLADEHVDKRVMLQTVPARVRRGVVFVLQGGSDPGAADLGLYEGLVAS